MLIVWPSAGHAILGISGNFRRLNLSEESGSLRWNPGRGNLRNQPSPPYSSSIVMFHPGSDGGNCPGTETSEITAQINPTCTYSGQAHCHQRVNVKGHMWVA